MLILFLRAVLLYGFILFILRMTGKRQIADLQPFDLIITMAIADLAATAISDTDIPLVYSVVPILALYLAQQAVAFLCLRSRRFRTFVCGSPLLLVREGVLQEGIMREANYTVISATISGNSRYSILGPSSTPSWRPTDSSLSSKSRRRTSPSPGSATCSYWTGSSAGPPSGTSGSLHGR